MQLCLCDRFAKIWSFRTLQNAPLNEQQQAAIVALSHAVSERPFPPNLVGTIYYCFFILVLVF